MKAILEDDKNKINNKLKIFYVVIIVICIISIIAGIWIQVASNEEETPELPELDPNQVSTYREEFNSFFKNKVNYMENNSYKITRIEQNKEIVYTGYHQKETKVNDYDLDVNVPYININNKIIEEFNKQIKETFEQRAKSILNLKNNNIIYTVNYTAYVTNNILSLVVKSTLKEGNNPQREIVQTYNYDLGNEKECTIENLLELKNITKQQANQKVRDEIKKVEENVSNLQQLGYNIFSRDSTDDIYSINNVTEYFIGENDNIYIVFAYGNTNNTSEMDIVIL